VSLRTRETVAGDTPAARATSLIVTLTGVARRAGAVPVRKLGASCRAIWHREWFRDTFCRSFGANPHDRSSMTNDRTPTRADPALRPNLERGTTSHGDLAVVMTGGGARGAYQVGVMRGLARRFPELTVP